MFGAVIIGFGVISFTHFLYVRAGCNEYSSRPNISWKAWALNLALWPMQYFKLSKSYKPMKLEEMKKIATKIAKYDDFEDHQFERPFDWTIKKIEEIGYSPLGYAAAKDFFIRRLAVKLRVNKELKDPIMSSALDTPVRKPIFVTGLPRTGTTFLHRLLAMDPEARAPLSYELLDPVQRYRDDVEKDTKVRAAYLTKALDVMNMIVPHFKAIHEVGAYLPEECLMSYGSDIPMFFATFHVLMSEESEYYNWEHVTAYKNYYRVLQLMQYQAMRNGTEKEGKRWVLKCPAHLLALDDLVKAFPDARIVWTHRDPKTAIPSFCSFLRACQDMYEAASYIQLDKIGRNLMYCTDIFLKRGHDFFMKSSQKANPHTSVHYGDLIKDPVGTVKAIYAQLGYEFTNEYEKILVDYIEKDRIHREEIKKKTGGKKMHNYSAEMFGLTGEEIDQKFGWYCETYLMEKK
mmetsp:Transcript_6173/g.8167  ORF Transcript_6173/g.8167 Transcript_6173/m.8167 type:complete len:460 (+) Transcript_6173:437-1816(+)